jgi:hypothetical protein
MLCPPLTQSPHCLEWQICRIPLLLRLIRDYCWCNKIQ